jgi:hypothetical protein
MTLNDQQGAFALRHVTEQIELFLCIGDYASVALWARAAEALKKLQCASRKSRLALSVEILPPNTANSQPGAATTVIGDG